MSNNKQPSELDMSDLGSALPAAAAALSAEDRAGLVNALKNKLQSGRTAFGCSRDALSHGQEACGGPAPDPVGMAIALSLKRIPNQLLAVKKVIVRTLKLLFWGILLQRGYSHAPDKLTYGVDMKNIRWCGILQRIALAYLVV